MTRLIAQCGTTLTLPFSGMSVGETIAVGTTDYTVVARFP